MKSLLLAAVALAALSSGAIAADAVAEKPVAAPYNWSGFYVGAQAGYSWGRNRISDTSGNYFPFKPNGFLGGLYTGYNHQFANKVTLGVDADAAWSEADHGSPVFSQAGILGGNPGTVDIEATGAARIRLGYAADRFLPYVAGGVAFAKASYGTQVNGKATHNYTGWTLGAGVEYAVTDKLILRGEYRYTDFGSHRADWSNSLGAFPVDWKMSSNDIRIGVAYKF